MDYSNVERASYSGFLPVSGYNRSDNLPSGKKEKNLVQDKVVGTQIVVCRP